MMHLRNFLLAGVGLAACIGANPGHAEPDEYVLDGDHTHIVWQVDRFGFANTVGTFANVTGTLVLDEAAPQNSYVTAEISLEGLRSDLTEREEVVRGPYWLDAAAYPVIHFVSESVTLLDDCDCATVAGTMTLKGVSAPLMLTVDLNKIGTDPVTKRKAAGFTAHGQFERADFGVMTALGPVGAVVDFQIEALAIKVEAEEDAS